MTESEENSGKIWKLTKKNLGLGGIIKIGTVGWPNHRYFFFYLAYISNFLSMKNKFINNDLNYMHVNA